jgi:hypothetical protein
MPELNYYRRWREDCIAHGILGLKIKEVIHQQRNFSPDIHHLAQPIHQNPSLLGLRGATIVGIATRATQIGFEVESSNNTLAKYLSLLFTMCMGSSFEWINEDQILLYPFKLLEDGRSRTNLYFTFENSTKILVVLDTWLPSNQAEWEIHLNKHLIDSSIWRSTAPDPIDEKEQWLEYARSKVNNSKYEIFP